MPGCCARNDEAVGCCKRDDAAEDDDDDGCLWRASSVAMGARFSWSIATLASPFACSSISNSSFSTSVSLMQIGSLLGARCGLGNSGETASENEIAGEDFEADEDDKDDDDDEDDEDDEGEDEDDDDASPDCSGSTCGGWCSGASLCESARLMTALDILRGKVNVTWCGCCDDALFLDLTAEGGGVSVE